VGNALTAFIAAKLELFEVTSSMREPVSTSAVAMIVSEPPCSMLRTAPKKRFGRCNALESTRPGSTGPKAEQRVVNARQTGDGVEQDHHIALVLDETLGLLDVHPRVKRECGWLEDRRGRTPEFR
jgi:hypothetical protein